ncbi:hypothetical protein E2C01_097150 [Portunus trituberculatus]|uniref:Uncharacterized protein n=1 Tax=Portunus trituberculatus TaxID=210409 RepID=A0A5B7K3X0_PORTR|nr:hypothetical protein [Portunus trituberculatus]
MTTHKVPKLAITQQSFSSHVLFPQAPRITPSITCSPAQQNPDQPSPGQANPSQVNPATHITALALSCLRLHHANVPQPPQETDKCGLSVAQKSYSSTSKLFCPTSSVTSCWSRRRHLCRLVPLINAVDN